MMAREINPGLLIHYALREVDERPYDLRSWDAYRSAQELVDQARGERRRFKSKVNLVIPPYSVEEKLIEKTDPDYVTPPPPSGSK